MNDDTPNLDLWFEYIEVSKKHNVSVEWVRGHDGNIGNEWADILARNGAMRAMHMRTPRSFFKSAYKADSAELDWTK